jgi:carbon-monoxide dehydrogenase medium subunit
VKPAKFRYVRSETAEEVVAFLAQGGASAKILAGGQSLIPALSARNITTSMLVDIMRCHELDYIAPNDAEIVIGSICRQFQIERSLKVQAYAPLLCEALRWVAMPQVRSRGTVVGCLAQANPGGEVPVVALALDAKISMLSQEARWQVPATDFFSAQFGAQLPPHTLLTSASFRARIPEEGWGFYEVQLRPAHFALVCCAATLSLDENHRIRSVRIAVGGVNANPYRASAAEKVLLGERVHDESLLREAGQIASTEHPWPVRADIHATASFRSQAAIAAVIRALEAARSRCLHEGEKTN